MLPLHYILYIWRYLLDLNQCTRSCSPLSEPDSIKIPFKYYRQSPYVGLHTDHYMKVFSITHLTPRGGNFLVRPPPVGLEPTTSKLTVLPSTYWLMEEYIGDSDGTRTHNILRDNQVLYSFELPSRMYNTNKELVCSSIHKPTKMVNLFRRKISWLGGPFGSTTHIAHPRTLTTSASVIFSHCVCNGAFDRNWTYATTGFNRVLYLAELQRHMWGTTPLGTLYGLPSVLIYIFTDGHFSYNPCYLKTATLMDRGGSLGGTWTHTV